MPDEKIQITEGLINSAKTEKGGYTKAQVDHAQSLFSGRWKNKMIGSIVTAEFWKRFCDLSEKVYPAKGSEAAKKKQKKLLKKVNIALGLTASGKTKIQPSVLKKAVKTQDFPKRTFTLISLPKTSVLTPRPQKRSTFQQNNSDAKDFYFSREWRRLRVKVLERYECKCMMCGRSPHSHGIVIHVDHIKPKSKHPELALNFDNLQLLCEDCNLGKSNKFDTDWRPCI